MPAETRTDEQKLIDGLLEVTTQEGMADILKASPLLRDTKTTALALASFARLIAIEKRLRWFERDMDRRLSDLEKRLKG